MNNLPPFDSVFFVHYHCDQFTDTDKRQRTCDIKIYTLTIRTCNESFDFTQDDERVRIEQYSNKIADLRATGLRLVHWNQDKYFYGPDHIKARYFEIAKQNIEVDYSNSINLGWELVKLYGDDYIGHPRLDNLAALNGISGSSNEHNPITYTTNRILLLQKIYTRAEQGILKTNSLALARPYTLRANLSQYGFFNLEKVRSLASDRQGDLLGLIAKNSQPYKIAMISFLGFIEHLDEKYFPVKNDRNQALEGVLNISRDTIKNQINALISRSEVNRIRYTSYKFLKDAELDYNKLK